MGWNTGIVVLNDALGDIKDDPLVFTEELVQAVRGAVLPQRRRDIRAGGHCNAASVVWSAHADNTGILAVGGNHATVLHQVFNGGRHVSEEDQIAILRGWAEARGFELRRKAKR